jgi:hypothetical protein
MGRERGVLGVEEGGMGSSLSLRANDIGGEIARDLHELLWNDNRFLMAHAK